MSTSCGERPGLDIETHQLFLGARMVAGVDEVGRGSWAGPLVAAAVILPLHRPDLVDALEGVNDSKQLAAAERERLVPVIRDLAVAIGIGWATRTTIDALGVGIANKLAIGRATAALRPSADVILVDHFVLDTLGAPCIAVTKGDARCLTIAAASVVAKVFRDRYMTHLDTRFPGYGFGRNKGYGTAEHRQALAHLGHCSAHRLSFRPFVAIAS